MQAVQKKRVTISDVALAAGVDKSTVSLALRNQSCVKDSTRARIHKIASQLNYVPNRLASALSGAGTQSIGILLQSLEGQFYTPFFTEFYQAIEPSRFSLSVQISFWNRDRQTRILSEFCKSRVEGVIWSAVEADEMEIEASQQMLTQAQIPSVMLSGDLSGVVNCMSVGVNTADALRTGAKYLAACGHRRVGILSGAKTPGMRGVMHQKRVDQAVQIMTETGFSIHPEDILTVSDNEYGAVAVAGVLANRPSDDRATAVFAMDDMLGRGLVAGLCMAGMTPPHPISVLGFDNSPGAEFSNPPLTTVSLQANICARHAAERLLRQIRPSQSPPILLHERIPPIIIKRSTCSYPEFHS